MTHNSLIDTSFTVSHATLEVKLGCFYFAQKRNAGLKERGYYKGFSND